MQEQCSHFCDTGGVDTSPTRRQQLRLNQTETIKAVARRLLADKGVASLSLREVAREMGVVSSALYRYFATRDELLTALVFDAYSDLGATVEAADVTSEGLPPRVRWRRACGAVRSWARAHPHEWALLYGTPLPGYVAPPRTIAAAARVTVVLGRILDEAHDAAPPRRRVTDAPDVATFLDVDALAAIVPHLGVPQYVGALSGWTTIMGAVSFELFGHYVGSVTNGDAWFAALSDHVADQLGID